MRFLLPLSIFLFSFGVSAKTISLLENTKSILPTVEVVKSGKIINVQFALPEMDVEKAATTVPLKEDFKTIKIKELVDSQSVGNPQLPSYSVIVNMMPENISVEYSSGDGKKFAGIVPVPAQPEMLRCLGCKAKPFTVDWKTYNSNIRKFYDVNYLGTFRGVPVTRVTFYPAQYNGDERALEIYPKIKFNIVSKNSEIVSFQSSSDLVNTAELNNRYLIVSPEMFVTALAPMVEWKRKLGYEVEVVTLESIGNNVEKLKEFFHSRYLNAATKYSYALIVGHETNFVTEYVSTSSSWKTPSDLRYFTMDGADDYIPDVFYGRLVVGSVEDVNNQVAKIIAYEKAQYTNDAGLANHIGIASNEGSNPSDVEYVQEMLKYFIDGFQVTPIYYFQANSASTPTNVNNSLNTGVAWFNYIGHGSGTSWPSMYRTYNSSDVKKLTSTEVRPVIIDVACQNGRFQYNQGKLGERFMNEVDAAKLPLGAAAYYGGSVNISWHPPAIMAIGINKIVVEKKLETLGAALLAGQIYLAEKYTDLEEVKDNLRWYHLFGDPSMMIRLNRQKDISAEVLDGKILIKSADTAVAFAKVVFFNELGEYITTVADETGSVQVPAMQGTISYSLMNFGYKYLEGTIK